MTDLAFASATEQAAAVAGGRVRARELLEAHLARIAAHNLGLRALTLRSPRSARAAADAADRATAAGGPLGPLHGVPIAVGDALLLTGDGHDDGTGTVHRLQAAGAIVFAMPTPATVGVESWRAEQRFGRPANPWDPTRDAAIGSGGAAVAVAAGLAAAAVEVDGGGALRIAAGWCGVYAHQPTAAFGGARRSLGAAVARHADDLDLLLAVMVGQPAPEPEPVGSPGPGVVPAGRRIAVWLDDPACPTDPEILTRLEAAAHALRDAGARVDVAKPDLDLVTASRPSWRPSPVDTERGRRRAQGAWRRFFAEHDVVLVPISPIAAPLRPRRAGAAAVRRKVSGQTGRRPFFDQLAWTGLSRTSAGPATVAPVGFTSGGLPVGVQVIGPPLGDRTTIDVARQLGRLIGGCATPPACSYSPTPLTGPRSGERRRRLGSGSRTAPSS